MASAEAMAKAVDPKKDLFISHGLPADFVEQLRAAADAVRQTIDARATSRTIRVGATAALRSDIRAARKAVRLIDTILRRDLKGSDTLREWESAKRVTRRGSAASSTVAPNVSAAKEGAAA